VADVGIGGFNSSAVEGNQRCLPEEVEPHQLSLRYQFGLNVDRLLEGNLEHDFSVGALGRSNFGQRFSDLFFLQTAN
jgi:hypothetical protein